MGISSAIFQYQLDKELNARIEGPEAEEVGLLQARKTRFSERGALSSPDRSSRIYGTLPAW